MREYLAQCRMRLIPGANTKLRSRTLAEKPAQQIAGDESAFLKLNRTVEACISPSILCRHNARLMLVLGDEIEHPGAISQSPSCSAIFGNIRLLSYWPLMHSGEWADDQAGSTISTALNI